MFLHKVLEEDANRMHKHWSHSMFLVVACRGQAEMSTYHTLCAQRKRAKFRFWSFTRDANAFQMCLAYL
jgi:hypothetical protein